MININFLKHKYWYCDVCNRSREKRFIKTMVVDVSEDFGIVEKGYAFKRYKYCDDSRYCFERIHDIIKDDKTKILVKDLHY